LDRDVSSERGERQLTSSEESLNSTGRRALERYEGTLVFISHDVHFIRKLATKVLRANAGKITSYVGGYDYFLEKTGTVEDGRAALTAA
jgi:ATPase subunit of ABC transporter with duplicated ATPase domains